MGSRIATIQRQARELGRLRSGTFEKPSGGRGRPVRSKTWILTSLTESYIEAAASLWGGKAEKWQPQGNGSTQFRVITNADTIDAIIPPGDPLSQSLEMWNKGGCARRCDGYTETLSDSPCICRADYGPEFHEVAPKDSTCKMTSRLNVVLPQMPDVGVWRLESHSFYAANELAASVDMLRSAAGSEPLIPVSLQIQQRTRVSKGQTKHFPVPTLLLRGGVTAGEILAASLGVAELAAPDRKAIGPARPDYVAQAKAATTIEEWRDVWTAVVAAGHMDDALKAQLTEIGKALSPVKPVQSAKADGTDEAEVLDVEADDPDELDKAYADVVDNCPDGWDMSRLNEEFARRNKGCVLSSGTVAELRAFLGWIKGGAR